MYIQHNYLRKYRKQSNLAQSDLAFIMNLKDYANVSRWEQGLRLPGVEILISYQLLFGVTADALYERQSEQLAKHLQKRLGLRIERLKELPQQDLRIKRRVENLEAMLTRFVDIQKKV